MKSIISKFYLSSNMVILTKRWKLWKYILLSSKGNFVQSSWAPAFGYHMVSSSLALARSYWTEYKSTLDWNVLWRSIKASSWAEYKENDCTWECCNLWFDWIWFELNKFYFGNNFQIEKCHLTYASVLIEPLASR